MPETPNANDVANLLPPGNLELLRKGYKRDVMIALLEQTLPAQYNAAGPYFTAAVETFFRHPVEDVAPRSGLDVKDRQRCIIALQASTGLAAPLAIHIYVSLGEEIEIHEIAHIILLAGLYTGVPNFFTGFETLSDTLKILNQLVSNGQADPKSVATALQKAFAVVRTLDVSAPPSLGIGRPPEPDTPCRIRAF